MATEARRRDYPDPAYDIDELSPQVMEDELVANLPAGKVLRSDFLPHGLKNWVTAHCRPGTFKTFLLARPHLFVVWEGDTPEKWSFALMKQPGLSQVVTPPQQPPVLPQQPDFLQPPGVSQAVTPPQQPPVLPQQPDFPQPPGVPQAVRAQAPTQALTAQAPTAQTQTAQPPPRPKRDPPVMKMQQAPTAQAPSPTPPPGGALTTPIPVKQPPASLPPRLATQGKQPGVSQAAVDNRVLGQQCGGRAPPADAAPQVSPPQLVGPVTPQAPDPTNTQPQAQAAAAWEAEFN